MRKTTLFTLMATLAMGTAMAQWTPSDTEFRHLDGQDTYNQAQLTPLITSEGKVALTWLRNVKGGVDNDHYMLHLQLFDNNGKAQFGDEGLIISNNKTRSYTNPYAFTLASNGDFLIGYNDIRRAPQTGAEAMPDMYLYRYSQQGQPVWNADGVRFDPIMLHDNATGIEQANVKICESGGNLYVAICEMEYLPGQDPGHLGPVTPDYAYHWQLRRLDPATGASLTEPRIIESIVMNLMPAPGGDVYAIYDNELNGQGILAQRLDASLNNTWQDVVLIESELLSKGIVPDPHLALTSDGGVTLFYRKFHQVMQGYQVIQHLSPDGTTLTEPTICNGTMDGSSQDAIMATRDDNCMVAYSYKDENRVYHMYVNEMTGMGEYVWTGYNLHGIALDSDTTTFHPIHVAPMSDGWVVFFGRYQTAEAVRFIATKVDEQGNEVWSKQIGEDLFDMTAISAVSDGTNAYIFFVRKPKYDYSGNVIAGSGGLFSMCVALTEKGSAIDDITVTPSDVCKTEIYTIDGKRVPAPVSGVNIIRTTDSEGRVTTTKVMK